MCVNKRKKQKKFTAGLSAHKSIEHDDHPASVGIEMGFLSVTIEFIKCLESVNTSEALRHAHRRTIGGTMKVLHQVNKQTGLKQMELSMT